MRGIYTTVNDSRKKVFAEVARLSYSYEPGALKEMDHIPYKIVPGEVSQYLDSVFLERAIVEERMRLAMGLNVRSASEHAPVSTGALYPVEIKKGVNPSKPTKNFNVLEKYNMPIMRGMIIDNAEKIRALNDDAFICPVSLLGF